MNSGHDPLHSSTSKAPDRGKIVRTRPNPLVRTWLGFGVVVPVPVRLHPELLHDFCLIRDRSPNLAIPTLFNLDPPIEPTGRELSGEDDSRRVGIGFDE